MKAILPAAEILARAHYAEWHLLYPGNTLEDFKADLRACTVSGARVDIMVRELSA